MNKFGVRTGAAAFALGLSLAGPQAVGPAFADTPDNGGASGPSSPRAAAARAGIAQPRATAQHPSRARRTSGAPVGFPAPKERPTNHSAAGSTAAIRPATSVTQARVAFDEPAIASALVEPANLPVASSASSTARSGPAAVASANAPAKTLRPRPVVAPSPDAVMSPAVRLARLLDSVIARLSDLPANPISDLASGALLLVRRTLLPRIPTIPMLTVSNALATEGDPEDPQSAVFTVTLDRVYADTVMVHYATADGTAIHGLDYTSVSGVLVFSPGQTTQTVSVGILADGIAEPDETFRLVISYIGDSHTVAPAASGRSAVIASGTGTIANLVSAAPMITFKELDYLESPLAVRVDPTQQFADAIKVDAGTTFTLTLPGPATDYTVMANKPTLVDITKADNQLTLAANTPGFLGLSVSDGATTRYMGLYIADPVTHLVPDTVTGYLPVGTVTSPNTTGDLFLETFNFRNGVAPIDYLYIYDQGGADYTDGNLRGLLTQAARHGMVPVVVFYNIQAVNTAAGRTGITEGWNAAYQAINDYNWSQSGQSDPNMFTNYMRRYFTKMATDFTEMNKVGIPVQVVMEPDFLGYMASRTPDFTSSFVPNPSDHTQNTANVSAMYDAGLLVRGTDPDFSNTLAGMVEAVNYYTATKTSNLRIGWKTNIWAVAQQQNSSLGLLHMTDPVTYPWQSDSQWNPTGPAPDWKDGRTFITNQAEGLGTFLKNVGATTWQGTGWKGSPDKAPFIAIDKYGVDGAYTYDPNFLAADTQTLAQGNLTTFIMGAGAYVASATDEEMLKYFGLNKAQFTDWYANVFPLGVSDPRVAAVYTTLQNAAKDDPNMALWFFNADQWNNYLLLVDTLSTTLDGTKVMLWQIPQGHINGSTDLPNTDLTNTVANFEDSATSYFFGDTFTATDGRLTHFGADQANDPGVTVTGNSITWGPHMALAADSGALSVLFGAGLGISTRGSVTPAGPANDNDFWFDKATTYLSGVGGQ